MKINKTEKSVSLFEIIILLFVSAAAITVCSKCSPLYPLNDWDDPNCFFTVGKAAANGKVLYRDIFEQKGPLLYFLHTLAYYVSGKTFLGIYLIEIAAAFFYLLFSYRTIRLFTGRKAFVLMPLAAALTYTSTAFQGGDSAEELCLPLAAYCLYIGLSAVKRSHTLSFRQCLITGLSIGITLWVKFTLLGFYIGFAIAIIIVYFKRKQTRLIPLSLLEVFLGIFIAALPSAVYFIINNSIDSLIEVYFYDNMFLYSTGEVTIPIVGKILNIFIGVGAFLVNNPFAFVCSFSGAVYLLRKQKKSDAFFYLTLLITTLIFVYIGGRFFAYYSIILSVFSSVGIAGIYEFIQSTKINGILLKKQFTIFLYTVSVFSLLLSPNIQRLRFSRDDYPQYRFNKTISKKKNASLLNYGFLDGGFYTVSGIIPECRFFCQLNVQYEDMYRVQDEFVKDGKVDFVVTKDNKLNSDIYKCVDECSFPYGSAISTYYLYEKI